MDLKDWKEVAKLQHWSESRSEKLQHDLLQARDINHPGEAREHRIPSLFIVEEIGINELEEQNASIWDQNTSRSFEGDGDYPENTTANVSRKTLCSKPWESFLLTAGSSRGTHCSCCGHWGAHTGAGGGQAVTAGAQPLPWQGLLLQPGWGLSAAAAAGYMAWLFWVHLALPALSWL